jgi:NhaP-type Na+/H+ or K+/H+ antiporter
VEKALEKSKRSITLLKLESIFNTPISVLLPILFLDLVALQPGAILEPMKYMSQFWQMIVAGVGTGIIIGFGFAKLIKRITSEYSVLMVLSISLITYALAEAVGGSGMLSVAICGLMVGNMTFRDRDDVKSFEDNFWEMLRISVLAMLGAEVALFMNWGQFAMALVFFAIVFFSRPLIVIPILGKTRNRMNIKDLVILSFIAPRGTDSAAIAPLVVAALVAAGSAGIATTIMNITVIIIILSILSSALIAVLASRNILIKDGPTLGELRNAGKKQERAAGKEEPGHGELRDAGKKQEHAAGKEEPGHDDYHEIEMPPENKQKSRKKAAAE